ncbi:MAG: hypothetical protein S4CHLAM37_01000 [Chlamydiia bacterium]|nr:hypothetical protein [Chlamydiia bacterium]
MLTLFFFLIAALHGISSNTTQQVITIRVNPVNEISITGGSAEIDFSPTIGTNKFVFSSPFFFSIKSNDGAIKKITAQLDSDTPDNYLLCCELSQAAGAISKGPVLLSTVETDILTNIPANTTQINSQLVYMLEINKRTKAQTFSRRVTYTLTDN